MRIGVDVGGTNTDAVLMDGARVVASHKATTSRDVTQGIIQAITAVLSAGDARAEDISAVMVGTTHFTNAFVERRGLQQVAVVRLCLPATKGLPPMVDWPEDIADAVGSHHYMVRGGYEFDGREINPLDEVAVTQAAQAIRSKGITAVAVSCVFSPVKTEMEERAGEILRAELPDASITLSSRIGRIGMLERENAAIMNASLATLSTDFVASFRRALSALNISAPFYISQNDGTLMSAEFVERYPVLTFASGPTNSMRGAAYLSGLQDALVVDIGGTTTDLGMLVNGFPRESSVAVDIGGVRTNFRMPDILAIGLGGGSIVRSEGDACQVGPQSVGYRLREEALVFGGSQLTATDVAVASGYADVGDARLVAHLQGDAVAAARGAIHRLLNDAVDRMKTSAVPVPVVLVGGGAILVRDAIPGTSEVIVPKHAGVANAIGASIAQVGGEIDKVYDYAQWGRQEALEDARSSATERAVAAGALPDSVKIIDLEELPLSYMPGQAVRVRSKAAGDLPL